MIAKYLFVSSLVAYGIACFSPAFVGAEDPKFNYTGLGALLTGIFSFFFSAIAFAAWSSNTLYAAIIITSFVTNKGKVTLIVLMVIAILLSLTAFGVDKLLVNEAGTTTPVKIGIGFWFWLLSYIIMLFYVIFKP